MTDHEPDLEERYDRLLGSPEPSPLRALLAQLDLDGQAHEIAPEHETMRLFEPAPPQLAGQTHLDTDHEHEEQS